MYGLSTALLDWDHANRDQLPVPMLIFCPPSLELERFRYPGPNTYYVEPGVHDYCPFEAAPKDTMTDVLVSFGTQTARYRRFPQVVSLIAQAAEERPDLHFTLTVGQWPLHALDPRLRALSNIFVTSVTDQRSCLCSARVFITHGGLGSLKEAMMQGRAPIVLPFLYDQPFNAMRIRCLGLGEALFDAQQTIGNLHAAIKRAESAHFGTEALAMRARMQQAEAKLPSRALVHAFIAP